MGDEISVCLCPEAAPLLSSGCLWYCRIALFTMDSVARFLRDRVSVELLGRKVTHCLYISIPV